MASLLSRPRRAARWFAFAALLAPAARAQHDAAPVLPHASILKQLTVDELLNLDVTSVSRQPEKLFSTASAVQVITAEDIRRSGATRLPEALRLASNLEVAQIDSRQWAITARGFNNAFADKMLVLIDGRTVYTPLYAGVYWDAQDTLLADLDRIEVISGPGATQWGANAVNGVINVTSKSAEATQGALVQAGGGLDLRHTVDARYGGVLAPGVYYRVYAKYFERGDSVRPAGNDALDAWRGLQGGFRVDASGAEGNAYTLQGDAYGERIGQPGFDSIRATGSNLLGRWTHTRSDDSEWKLQAYVDRTHRSIPGSFTQDLITGDLDFQHRFPLAAGHDVVWGLGYRASADDIINTPANAFLPANVTHQWFNTFFQDRITLSPDRLIATLGTKVEHNDYTGLELEPSVRVAWTPTGQAMMWGAVSRAVRTPSRIDRDLFSPAVPPYRISGGPHVVSEKLLAYELGGRVQLNPRLLFSVATFLNYYDDLRSLEPLTPPLPFPAEASSGLQGWSAGAELTAEWRATSAWRLRAGYTEMRVHSEPQPGTPDRSTRASIARDPNHQLQLHSLLDLSARWEWDTALRYVAPIGSQDLPGYTELDLRLGWQPAPEWELSLLGSNLLHDHHAEFNSLPGRREVSRSVYLQATWRR